MAKPSEHEADRCPTEKGKSAAVEAFPIFGQPAATIEPSDGALDDPSLGQDDELAEVRAFDDLDVHLLADGGKPIAELVPLIAAVGIEFE